MNAMGRKEGRQGLRDFIRGGPPVATDSHTVDSGDKRDSFYAWRERTFGKPA